MDKKQSRALRLNLWLLSLTKNWLKIAVVAVGVYATLPFVAPTLMKMGATGVANVLYTLYSPMCHQFAFRSIFLYGEQPFYPREIAHTDYRSYESYIQDLPNVVKPASPTDFTVEFVFSARDFRGNEQMGYKTTMCARDSAIYLAMFVGALFYARFRTRIRPLPFWIFIIAGLAPIGLDGMSQLLSYTPFNLWEVRETAPFFRIATGAMFGLMVAWLAFPYLEITMKETREQIEAKLMRFYQKYPQARK